MRVMTTNERWGGAYVFQATTNHIKNQEIDLVVLLGDRWETLCAAAAAACSRIPICHIHGGERTIGAMDDNMRHAISKLSHIHCVANEDFGQTLRKMGERNIHVTGAPGLDNLTPFLGDRKPERYFVCTYHPETLGNLDGIQAMIEALKNYPDYTVYWTGVNNDPESDVIKHMIETSGVGEEVEWGLGEYLWHCRHATAVIGNSSSGIIEAPYLWVPTVNIGDRQDGRPMGESIWSVGANQFQISEAIMGAIDYEGPFDQEFGDFGASKRIADIIVNQDLDNTDILRKPWHI